MMRDKNQEMKHELQALLPKAVKDLISSGSDWTIMAAGQSGDLCFRVLLNNGETAYLKSHLGNHLEEPHHEIEVSKWLEGKVPAAKIIASGRSETSAHWFNLWSEVRGQPLHELVGKVPPEEIVKIVAIAAAKLHLLEINSCILNQRLAVKVSRALARARQGLVSLGNLDPIRKAWSLQKLVATLEGTMPSSEDLVFTHGDFCLPNIISLDGKFSGVIDLGRAGIADRYQDISLALRSLHSSVGNSYADLFLEHYSCIEALDRDRLDFYQLMDEFF